MKSIKLKNIILIILSILTITGCKDDEDLITVNTGAASDVTFNTVKLSGSVVGADMTMQCGFIYDINSDPSKIGTKSNLMTSKGAYSIVIKGLKPNTRYYYQAFINNGGKMSYGEVKSFTTLETPKVTTKNAESLTESSAIVGGKITGCQSSVECGVLYGTINNLDPYKSWKVSTTSSSMFTVTLKGLSAGVVYYYCAYILVDGEYILGDVKNFTTQKKVTVTTGTATDITKSGATLKGSVSGTSTSIECGIIYDTSGNPSSTRGTMMSTKSSGSYSVSVSGLKASTKYYYCAYAKVDGNYKYGDVKSFTTNQDVTVTTGSATDITSTGATLKGTVNGTSSSVECGIIYSTSTTPTSSNGYLKSTKSSGSFSVTVSGLKASTKYYYRAYAKVDGEYKYGEVYNFTTNQSISVTTGSATNITESGATLKGTVNGASSSMDCGVIYSTSSTPTSSNGYLKSTMSSGSYSVNVSGLKASTKYYYRAYVKVSGEYVYGDTKYFTTAKKEETGYKVGDFYPNSTSPEGVVFYVDNTGKHGKIVSLTQVYCQWENNDIFGEGEKGNYDMEDGSNSKLPKKSTLNDFITGLGTGWYCPAKGELLMLADQVAIVNETLRSGDYRILDEFYYSCNETIQYPYGICVYVVKVTEYYNSKYPNKHVIFVSKSNSEYARGVKKF